MGDYVFTCCIYDIYVNEIKVRDFKMRQIVHYVTLLGMLLDALQLTDSDGSHI